MPWESFLLEPTSAGANLPARIDALFVHQRKDWPALRTGEATLSAMMTKVLEWDGARVVVQSNRGRRKSVHAKVDRRTIADRPCFLCPENLPAEERGIRFGELVILPNPYPILHRHCTIPTRDHRPQRLAGHVGTMLELARALGPEMLVFYNGPRSGASAPDHFHFQACNAEGVPILDEIVQAGATAARSTHTSFGRRMLVFADGTASHVEAHLDEALSVLGQLVDGEPDPDEEPMFSLLAYDDGVRYVSILFPRAAHRPSCYFAEGSKRLAISPAALEMAGILVVAETDHFERVDVATARSIYEEVCLDRGRFEQLAKALR